MAALLGTPKVSSFHMAYAGILMLLRMASFSRFVFVNMDGAATLENLGGGPFGGNSKGLASRGLLMEDGTEVGADRSCPEEVELDLELSPLFTLFVYVVARDTVLLVVLEGSGLELPCPEAVNVKVKYCSSSVAQTEMSI